MEATLLSYITTLVTTVIAALSAYSIILAALGPFFGRNPCWQEEIGALGGTLWFVGIFGWHSSFGLPDVADIGPLLRYIGVALLILSRLFIAARGALENG